MPTEHTLGFGRSIIAVVASMARAHVKLVAIEIVQEVGRIRQMLVLAAMALVCGALGLMSLSVIIVVSVGEEHRLMALSGLSAFYLVAALLLTYAARQKARGASHLLAGLFRTLTRDMTGAGCECE